LYSGYFEAGGWGNQHGFDDPVIDRYAKAGLVLPPSAAVKDWQKMWHRVVTQADELPVAQVYGFYYVNKKVGGVAFSGKSGTADPIYWHPR
jgi:hypothetical protein